MADVSTIGIQVDASGALSVLSNVTNKLESTGKAADVLTAKNTTTGASFDKGAAQLIAYNQRANETRAALGQVTDQLSARDAQIQKTNANIARIIELDAKHAAVANELKASLHGVGQELDVLGAKQRGVAEAEAEALAAMTAQAKAVDQTGAAFNRLRPMVTSLASSVLGLNGPFNSVLSTLAMFSIGNPLTVGIIAAGTAIGAGWHVLSKEARDHADAIATATKELVRWHEEEKLGAGGKLAQEIKGANEQLVKLSTNLQKATADLQLLSVQKALGGESGAVGSVLGLFAGQDYRAALSEYTKARDAIAAAKQQQLTDATDAAAKADAEARRELTDLVKNNAATHAERQHAIDLLQKDRERLALLTSVSGASSVFASGLAGERNALSDEIKALNEALNPTPAKVHAVKEAVDSATESQAQYRRELAANHLALVTVLTDIENMAIAQRTPQARANAGAVSAADPTFGNFNASIGVFIDKFSIGATNIHKEFEGTSKALVAASHNLPTLVDTSRRWVDELQAVLSIAEAIGNALDASGSGLGRAISGASRAGSQIAHGVITPGIGGALDVVTGIAGLGNALASLDHSQEHAQQRADALSAAYDRNTEAMRRTVQAATDSATAIAADVTARNAAAEAVLASELNAARGDEAKVNAAFQHWRDALSATADTAIDRARAMIALADELRASNESLLVRGLRASGQGDRADLQVFDDQQKAERDAEHAKFMDAAHDQLVVSTQAAERIKFLGEQAQQAAEKLETAHRETFDLTNGARAFNDPRGASEAAFEENQRRRLADATDKAAAATFNFAEAADHAAQTLAQDFAQQSGYLSRILAASGNANGASDVTRLQQQIDEQNTAHRNGITDSNQFLLDRAQYSENSAVLRDRNIAAGTKTLTDAAKVQTDALDATIANLKATAEREVAQRTGAIADERTLNESYQNLKQGEIDAIKTATEARLAGIDAEIENTRKGAELAQQQLQAATQQLEATKRAVDSLKQFNDSLNTGDLSTLSPLDKVTAAQKSFDDLVKRAQAGDANAAAGVGGAGSTLLSASRAFNGSSTGYVDTFNAVQQAVGSLQSQFGGTLDTQQQAVDAAQAAVDAYAAQLASLQALRESVSTASEKEIKVLEAAKADAAAASQRRIDSVQKEIEAINSTANAQVAAAEAAKLAIAGKLTDAIATLTANENAAHQARLDDINWRDKFFTQQAQARDYLQTMAEHFTGVSTGFGRVDGAPVSDVAPVPVVVATPPAPDPTALAQLDEARQMRAEVRALLADIRGGVTTGTAVAVTASGEETNELRGMRSEIRALTGALNMAAQGAALTRAGKRS